jgi:hypothetical protein
LLPVRAGCLRDPRSGATNTLFHDKNTLFAPEQGIARNRLNAHRNGSPSAAKRRVIRAEFEELPDVFPDGREIAPRARPSAASSAAHVGTPRMAKARAGGMVGGRETEPRNHG